MEKRAREVMTPDPACCTPTTTLDQVAKMMIQTDCGEIPVLDVNDRVIGVVTDRDIVCRVVAEGKNPMAYTGRDVHDSPGRDGHGEHAGRPSHRDDGEPPDQAHSRCG